MAAKQGHIELVKPNYDKESPCCAHGPTLLFERWDQSSKASRQFYACSAFRDRKACSFFQWVETSQDTVNSYKQSHGRETSAAFSHRDARKRYLKFKKLPKSERHVCCSCGLLLLDGELSHHEGKGHILKRKVGLKDLKQPSFLFRPLDDNKTFAQYLFSKNTVDFLLNTLTSLGYTHILCVGTPRIHEAIQHKRRFDETSCVSMLLDLDDRYAQLYPPSLFTKYNMFNHHFFECEGKAKVSEFLSEGAENVVLVTDPPFGGMVEALAASFLKLAKMWKGACEEEQFTDTDRAKDPVLPTVWFFPYFMEGRIESEMPSVTMLDYKVDYDNHSLFNNQVRKKGSPVRIFTNIPQAFFKLPQEEGYWFCELCQRYSSKENWHCKDCGSCTSKDGTTYVHCDACLRCVKPSRSHCFTCGMCQLKDHVCGEVHASGCYTCGMLDHKRRECPKKKLNDKDAYKRPHKREANSLVRKRQVKKFKTSQP